MALAEDAVIIKVNPCFTDAFLYELESVVSLIITAVLIPISRSEVSLICILQLNNFFLIFQLISEFISYAFHILLILYLKKDLYVYIYALL